MGSTILTLPIFTNEPPRDALWVWLALFFCFKASSIVFTLCHIFFYELCIKHWKIEEGEVHFSFNFSHKHTKNTQKWKFLQNLQKWLRKPTPNPPLYLKHLFCTNVSMEDEKNENRLLAFFKMQNFSPKHFKSQYPCLPIPLHLVENSWQL